MSPDWSDGSDPVPYASYDNPQSLNLYSYVLNNPLGSTDSDGHYSCDPDKSTTTTDASGVTTVTVTAGACHYDWGDFVNLTSQIAQKTISAFSTAVQQASNYLAAPRNPGCMAMMAAGGAAAGAFAGGTLGAIGGGAGGTLVAPGVGTIGGGVAGAAAGAGEGTALGGSAGAVAGFFACASGGSGGGGSTQHGAERANERNMSQAEYDQAKTGTKYVQDDGAVAYVKKLPSGRYNVVVENENGATVTVMKNKTASEIRGLAANYGWR